MHTHRSASRQPLTRKVCRLLVAVSCLLVTPLFAQKTGSAPAATARAGVVKEVSPDEAEKLLKGNPQIIVLDVRTPGEFAAGHIAGARNLDFKAADFAAKIAALDKGKSYLVHCAAGGRSAKTLDLMEGKNFAPIYHLSEGFRAWEKAGKPVEK